MNIMKFKLPIVINSYTMPQIKSILNYNNPDVAISYQTKSSIILNNNERILCIKNYYTDKNNNAYNDRGNDINCCSRTKKFFNLGGSPFDCANCHLLILGLLENKEVKLKTNKKKSR